MCLTVLLFRICVSITILYALNIQANGFGKSFSSISKMAGGKKNPAQQLIKFLTTFPAQIEKYAEVLAQTNANIIQARMMGSDPRADIQTLGSLYINLSQSIFQLQTSVVNFKTMPLSVSLQTFNQMCVSSVLTAAMALPGAGQVVVGLCGKITALDMKLELLLARAEASVGAGLAAKEMLNMRLMGMPGGMETLMQMPQMPPLPVAPMPINPAGAIVGAVTGASMGMAMAAGNAAANQSVAATATKPKSSPAKNAKKKSVAKSDNSSSEDDNESDDE